MKASVEINLKEKQFFYPCHYWKNLRALRALEDLEPFLKIFYTSVCKNFPWKIAEKYMENLKQASAEI